ncbi:MAG: SDR family oxidoreductase [Hyphomicrobiaceae bacterium]
MQLTMTGRNALITGGSLGIGRAIALRFLEAGAGVAIVARRREVLDEARMALASAGHAGQVVAVAADISSIEGCSRAFGEAERQLGQIDVVVNNAGKSATGKFLDITDEVWAEDIELKLMAAVRLARFAMPGMIARRWGRIINVLNTGSKAPPAGGAPTAVTRAAGLALTKVLAGEGAPHNVLVNALLVGRIESDQWVRRAAAEGKSLDQYYTDMGRIVPMGRVGTAQEFANAACFLASDAGSYVTGTAINVDGGLCPVV